MDKQNSSVIIRYKNGWTISKSLNTIVAWYRGKPLVYFSREFVDIAELGFRFTDSNNLQVSMAGQPVMIVQKPIE